MGNLVRLAELVASLDVGKLLLKIYKQKKTQDFIIGLNTREQLFINSEDSEGRKLGDIGGGYSPVTEELSEGISFQYQGESNVKLAGESPFLFDTGDFYKSWTVTPNADGFSMDADPMKDGTNLFDQWGINILGLTDESTELFQNFLLVAMAQEIEARFNKIL